MRFYIGRSWSGRSLYATRTIFIYLRLRSEHTLTIPISRRTLGAGR